MPTPKRIFTDTQTLSARNLYVNHGHSLWNIGRCLRCSPVTVRKLLISQGVKIREQGRPNK